MAESLDEPLGVAAGDELSDVASAMYCGPQSQRIRSPRATSFANRPKAWRTPWLSGSSAAQRSPIFAVCQPTSSASLIGVRGPRLAGGLGGTCGGASAR